MVWLPAVKAAVANAATPVADRVTVANGVAPSRNVTVPVFTAAVDGATAVTVAVNVTELPYVDGLAEETRAVDVLAAFTVCLSDPLLLLNLMPSLHRPAIACLP